MPRKPGEKILRNEKREKNREYNRARPAIHAFYSSSSWRKLRDYMKSRYPLCAECLKHGRVTQGVIVDHIVPITEGGAMMDIKNLQVLCVACHNSKHGALKNEREKTNTKNIA